MSILLIPALVVAALLLLSSIKILKEYDRGVVFRLGSYSGVRGPGLIILIPVIETMTKVDLRIVTMDIPSQDIITKDNVTLKVNGVGLKPATICAVFNPLPTAQAKPACNLPITPDDWSRLEIKS